MRSTTFVSLRGLLVLMAVLALLRPAAAQKYVPFRAAFSGIGIADASRFPVLKIDITGGGNATHLGRFTTAQSHFINVFDPSGAFTGGTYTFTAANGDTIYGSYSGVFLPVDEGRFSINGAFTIEGGTGRFAGATGGGDASGILNPDGTSDVLLQGVISTVGSAKRK